MSRLVRCAPAGRTHPCGMQFASKAGATVTPPHVTLIAGCMWTSNSLLQESHTRCAQLRQGEHVSLTVRIANTAVYNVICQISDAAGSRVARDCSFQNRPGMADGVWMFRSPSVPVCALASHTQSLSLEADAGIQNVWRVVLQPCCSDWSLLAASCQVSCRFWDGGGGYKLALAARTANSPRDANDGFHRSQREADLGDRRAES